MFLHVSVILFGGSATPPGQAPPGRYPPRQTPTCADTPWADTPPRANTPPTAHPPAQCMLGYSQQADGTHPTGLQSC